MKWLLMTLGIAVFLSTAPAPAMAGRNDLNQEKVVDKTKDTAKTVGHETKKVLSKTGEEITDGWILTRINTAYAPEHLLKDSHIDVDVKDRSVTLNGTVMSAAGRNKAIEIAKKVEGVRHVTSKLKIGPKTEK
jgi:hyperosmotically inducible periplasmic protein